MRGWVKLGKPRKNISATLVREFYANARKNPDVEDSREFRTFVRGVSFGFSKEIIRAILELKGTLDSETSFNVRKLRANRDTDAILRDICVEGVVWETGAHMNPLKLRRQDLTLLARGWHDFIIHNIKPTSNQSEVTVERAVLIHCIITSQEVEVEEIIEDTMTSIISKLHLSKPPLAFPNVIARLLEESGALQQMNPALIPILPMHIPFRIQSNVNENRPMFDGILRPWPVGGESSPAPPQQAPSEANAPRRENPDSDDE
ncbi:hypothetical protein PIB30_102327 [Stylosanthes scabra]|uniref:Putative plant transposon protein domain-containing protein n=1 Tax=Stylosanthes scabra TaxID=79078 RepID=A0ABU6UWM2_9FABA|nr:hypothetical protein [Stylosanthes scabra]